MFAHRKTKGTNERGALMIEAIAMLGLMTMMSPMIVRQAADRHAETEEVGMANQIKELKKALAAWIAENYQSILQNDLKNKGKNYTEKSAVPAAQLAPYLPTGFLEEDEGGVFQIKGQKLADSYKVGVRKKCMDVEDLGGGNKKCLRAQVTGLILSESGEQLDDRRAARIASMIGADGGYMLSDKMLNTLGIEETEKKKIIGTQGVWSGKADDFFDDVASGGRVAATTVYSGSFGGDYLYRRKVDGMPDANSMFTDLDMNGNLINAAGGLQVINGKIQIDDKITLAQEEVGMDVSDTIDLKADNTVNMKVGSVRAKLNSTGINMGYGDQQLLVDSTGVIAKAGSSSFSLKQNDVYLNATEGSFFSMDTGTSSMAVGSALLMLNQNTAFLNTSASSLQMNKSHATLDAAEEVGFSAGNDYHMHMNTSSASFGRVSSDKVSVMQATNDQIGLYYSPDNSAFQSSTDNSTYASSYINGSGIFSEVQKYQDGNLLTARQEIYAAGINMIVDHAENGRGSFHLGSAAANISFGTGDEFDFNAEGMKFVQDKTRITFNSAGSNVSMFSDGNYIMLSNAADEANAKIGFYTDGGIRGSYFQPDLVLKNEKAAIAKDWVKPVRSRAQLIYTNEDTGETKANLVNSSFNQADASVIIDCDVKDNGTKPYCLHNKDTRYNRYRVDPAFVSVMNDIKQTSRGGARLSEALPNYILKGIYVLSNNYTAGPWPCSAAVSSDRTSPCGFYMPYYTKADLGLASGGYEFNCENYNANPNSNTHPMKGTCSVTDQKYVTFDYYKSNGYRTCANNKYCWAHPFMGKVPAPGYKVTTKVCNPTNDNEDLCASPTNDILYAHAEGVCPDGYQAVLTLTPNTFETGRVLMYNPYRSTDRAKVKSNYGLTDFDHARARSGVNMIQQVPKIGLQIQRIKKREVTSHTDASKIESADLEAAPYVDGDNGWAIAMGTVTPTIVAEDGVYPAFTWNFGGIPANSWTVLAHTYCYFNPQRFTMPNMRFKKIENGVLGPASNGNTQVVITPMETPDDI